MIRIHVLVVDDEPDIREIIDLSLGRDPIFAVRCCGSGGEALNLAAEWFPDLILLDITMPDMDGLVTLAKLHDDKLTDRIPVIFMTAHTQAHETKRFHGAGAVGVIAKPFDPISLAGMVRSHVAIDGKLAHLRDTFLKRLGDDAAELAACRSDLVRPTALSALGRIRDIAHALAGASGIYGLAGMSCESAMLEKTTEHVLAGRGRPADVEPVLDRLLSRM